MAKGKGQTGETEAERRKRCVELLCAVIATSDKGIRRICDAAKKDDPTFPHKSTFLAWFAEDKELADQFARAKELQADHLAEQIIEIADDSSEDELFIGGDDESGTGAKRVCNNEFIQRSKLRVDARKWVASKLAPKKYGDKIEQTLQNPDGSALTIQVVKFGDSPSTK